MWFRQIIRQETGCASYMIGSSETGECAVFDPLWDVTPYHEVAQHHGSRITHVIDSHSHADHVSGARRLTAQGEAELLLPRLAEITYPATRLDDGDRIRIGEVELEVMHVPGHRPEQINLVVRDLSRSELPWCLLTADFLMVGDLSRPDLAQGGAEGAETLFEVSIPKLKALPDFVEVYPGHVAGST